MCRVEGDTPCQHRCVETPLFGAKLELVADGISPLACYVEMFRNAERKLGLQGRHWWKLTVSSSLHRHEIIFASRANELHFRMVSHISSDMLKSPCIRVCLSVCLCLSRIWERQKFVLVTCVFPFYLRVELKPRLGSIELNVVEEYLRCWGTEFVIGMAILGIQGRFVHWGYVRGTLLAMRETLLGGDWRAKTPLLKSPSALELSGTCWSLILQIQVGDLKPAG